MIEFIFPPGVVYTDIQGVSKELMKTRLSLMGIALGASAALGLRLLFHQLQPYIGSFIVVVGWVLALGVVTISVLLGAVCLTKRIDPLFYMRPYFALLSLLLCVLLLGEAGLSLVQAEQSHVFWPQAFGAMMAQVGATFGVACLAHKAEIVVAFLWRGADWPSRNRLLMAYLVGTLFFDATLAITGVLLQLAAAFQTR